MTYEDVKAIRSNPTAADVDNTELSKMIDVAIDKQIPMRFVAKAHKYGDSVTKSAHCARCKAGLDWDEGLFCWKCGQKIDWSEE